MHLCGHVGVFSTTLIIVKNLPRQVSSKLSASLLYEMFMVATSMEAAYL